MKKIAIYLITAIVAFFIGAGIMTMLYEWNMSSAEYYVQYRQCEMEKEECAIEKDNLNDALIRCEFGVKEQ